MPVKKRVYLGLPKAFWSQVIWVPVKYRTNPLSHQPGGADVVVEYHNKDIFGYDRIKKPARYISAIWNDSISKIYKDYHEWDEEEQLDEIKSNIRSIHARCYNEDDFERIYFEEIWNSETSMELPWKLLESFDNNGQPEKIGYCQNCNKKLSGNKSKPLCYDCWKQRKPKSSMYGMCARCGKKLHGDKSKELCYNCWSSKYRG
jgi:hypothetical protein